MTRVDSNINIQMNHWFAEMTNMDVVLPLFNYIEVCDPLGMTKLHLRWVPQNTWAPRGAETAQILYNISRGWVTHDEVFVSFRGLQSFELRMCFQMNVCSSIVDTFICLLTLCALDFRPYRDEARRELRSMG